MGSHRSSKPSTAFAPFLILLVAVGPAAAQLTVYRDFASFAAAVESVTEIDFEDLPPNGTSCPIADEPRIPNPLTISGVTFRDPACLATGFCSSPTCQPDQDNAQGGNIVLFLNRGGTVELDPGIEGTLLEFQGMGDKPFSLEARDRGGFVVSADARGVPFGIAYVGFTSTHGVDRIGVTQIGEPGGPVVLSAVFTGDLAGKACPASLGFWKNHEETWPVDSLTVGDERYTAAELLALLRMPSGGDASLILAHQLIPAKLSVAAGSDVDPVSGTIGDADALLAGYAGKLPFGVRPFTRDGRSMTALADTLDVYNHRALTPNCEPGLFLMRNAPSPPCAKPACPT